MQWWDAALWGLLGGALFGAIDFTTVINRIGDWPWNARKKMRVGPYFAGLIVRILAGGGLAATFGQSGLVTNALFAVTIGLATPLIVEKLSKAGIELPPGSQS